MIIALDAMGGDFAPDQAVRGAVLAARELQGQTALVGAQDQIEEILAKVGARGRCMVRHAGEVVGMEDSPRSALRGKPDSSVARTVEMVLSGEAQACVSAGNSGAFMALCANKLKTIPGIHRPAIAMPLPTIAGPRVLLDAGANADCKPVYLQQFGIMGSVYAQHVLGIDSPRVGILSIGTEAHKGNELTQAAMPLLEQAPINFIGNVEGDQIFGHLKDGEVGTDVDVVVCDGFAGNVALKVMEGVALMLVGILKQGIRDSAMAKLGAALMQGVLREVGDQLDYGRYGGALLLGVNGICIVSHGKSDANAIKSALLLAERSASAGVVTHVGEACASLLNTEVVAT